MTFITFELLLMKKRNPLKCSQQWTRPKNAVFGANALKHLAPEFAQSHCQVADLVLKGHVISGGEWWDWLAAHFLSCDPGPASYCTPLHQMIINLRPMKAPILLAPFSPPATVLLRMEEEKNSKFCHMMELFNLNPTATWKPTLRVLWLQDWYFKLSPRRIHWNLEVFAHISWWL